MPWLPGLTVRVLTHERARAGSKSTQDALFALVRRHGLAGMTVTRALEGFTPHGGMRTSGHVDLGDDLPLIIEIVDRADRIEPLLPQIAALVTSGVLTVADTRLYFPATHLLVRDEMRPPGIAVQPETPLSEGLARLLEGDTRLLPVVAVGDVVVGVLTLDHVLAGGDAEWQVGGARVAALRTPADIRAYLGRLAAGRTVGERMLAEPVTMPSGMELGAAARLLAERGVTRAPVVDAQGRLVGMLAERDILAAIVAPSGRTPASQPAEATLRLCVLPGAGERLTAGALAERELPLLPGETPLREVVAALDRSPLRLALVVGADGALRGVIDDRALLAPITPRTDGGLSGVWRRFVSHAPAQVVAALHNQPEHVTAETLARPPTIMVAEDTLVLEALKSLLGEPHEDVAVVITAQRRAVGAFSRQGALRVLVE
ncbi:MAG: hypothetical protein OJF49_004299 [Ktedonobacterales bacterium]|jgi:CBS domain-containing protein|nr:MAG: hypothetical protein OJF49_004299 [Ktedonobacterales bacterium]